MKRGKGLARDQEPRVICPKDACEDANDIQP